MNKRIVVSFLLAPVLAMQSVAVHAETYVVPNTQESVEVREAVEQDVSVLENQVNQIQSMDEDFIRIQLELQANQIEQGLIDAENKGTVIAEETKEQVHALADSIRDYAKRPHLKKGLLKKALLFLPRVIGQGIGYLTTGMTDLIAIPLIFTTMTSFYSFAGENVTGAGLGGGIAAGILTGATVTIGELLVLGYAFPVYIGTIVPVQLTVSLICEEGRKHKSPHTRKFCANIQKNRDFLDKIGQAGENTGTAINNFFRHPLKTLGLRKRR